jgi:hypothetical protein
MQITKQIKHGLTITIDQPTQKDAWAALASAEEVFGETACGKCKSKFLRHLKRINGKHTYYELLCLGCGARLAMGVHDNDSGTLFPRRKDNDTGDVTGEPHGWLPDRGWLKWDPETKKQV